MKPNPLYHRPDGSPRRSAKVKNGQVIHPNRFWRRGRGITRRIDVIVDVSGLTLSDVARLAAVDFDNITQNPDLMLSSDKANLSATLAGRRNTRRYVQALERAWGLPIDELRRIYREDRERDTEWSAQELNAFRDWYREATGRSAATGAEYREVLATFGISK